MEHLRVFFDQYAAALSAADAQTIAAAYADQFLAAGPGFHHCMQNDAHFLASLESAGRRYRRIGMHIIAPRAYTETPLDRELTLIRIEWQLLRADGSELVSFAVTYVVQAVDGAPKIIFSIAHNEQQRMREKGLISR